MAPSVSISLPRCVCRCAQCGAGLAWLLSRQPQQVTSKTVQSPGHQAYIPHIIIHSAEQLDLRQASWHPYLHTAFFTLSLSVSSYFVSFAQLCQTYPTHKQDEPQPRYASPMVAQRAVVQQQKQEQQQRKHCAWQDCTYAAPRASVCQSARPYAASRLLEGVTGTSAHSGAGACRPRRRRGGRGGGIGPQGGGPSEDGRLDNNNDRQQQHIHPGHTALLLPVVGR